MTATKARSGRRSSSLLLSAIWLGAVAWTRLARAEEPAPTSEATPAAAATNDDGVVHEVTVQGNKVEALKHTWNADVTSALGATFRVGDNDGD